MTGGGRRARGTWVPARKIFAPGPPPGGGGARAGRAGRGPPPAGGDRGGPGAAPRRAAPPPVFGVGRAALRRRRARVSAGHPGSRCVPREGKGEGGLVVVEAAKAAQGR